MKLLCLLLLLSSYLGNSFQVYRHQPTDCCIMFKNQVPGYMHSARLGYEGNEECTHSLGLNDGEYMIPCVKGVPSEPWNVQIDSWRPNQKGFQSNKVKASCLAECTLSKTSQETTQLVCVEPGEYVASASEHCNNNKCALVRTFENLYDIWDASNG